MGCSRDIPALLAFINGRQNTPHEVGREANDCVSFALGAVEAQTGKKVARQLKWKSMVAAGRIIARYGSLENAFDAFFERVPPSLAKRGDIGGVRDDDFGIHPMIVEGEKLVGPGDKGNKRLPRRAMVVAWSICC